jgi:hypothetical protein
VDFAVALEQLMDLLGGGLPWQFGYVQASGGSEMCDRGFAGPQAETHVGHAVGFVDRDDADEPIEFGCPAPLGVVSVQLPGDVP